MYFDFEDYRPDTPTLDRSLTQLEIVLLTVVVHLLIVITMLAWPHLPFVKAMYAAQEQRIEQERQKEQDRLRDHSTFAFVAPKVEIRTQVPPKLAELSDRNRRAQTMEKARIRRTTWRSRAATRRRRSSATRARRPAALGAAERAGQSRQRRRQRSRAPADPNAFRLPARRRDPARNDLAQLTLGGPSPGLISDAIRNVRSTHESRCRTSGKRRLRAVDQFDTKGADFGPWLRRFVAQIGATGSCRTRRCRCAAVVSASGAPRRQHHDLQVLRPSSIDAFTKSAHNAIQLSNPTVPLPARVLGQRTRRSSSLCFNETPPGESRASSPLPTRAQQTGLFLVLTVLAIYAFARAWSG